MEGLAVILLIVLLVRWRIIANRFSKIDQRLNQLSRPPPSNPLHFEGETASLSKGEENENT